MSPSKKIIVTGAAGFIGSSICEYLLQMGSRVIGIDSLTDYYDIRLKRANLESLASYPGFSFIEKSILNVDWPNLHEEVDTVYHQAAQAGATLSGMYSRLNIFSRH